MLLSLEQLFVWNFDYAFVWRVMHYFELSIRAVRVHYPNY